jgi:hypothetical protein
MLLLLLQLPPLLPGVQPANGDACSSRHLMTSSSRKRVVLQHPAPPSSRRKVLLQHPARPSSSTE